MSDEIKLDNFKELAWEMMLDEAIRKMVAANPVLSFGPVLILMTLVIRYFAIYFYQVFSIYIKTDLIVFTNAELQKQFGVKAVGLKQVAVTKGIESPEFKEARRENQKALSDFTRYDRIRPL